MAEYIKGIYTNMNKWVFWICLGVSLTLLITAFFVPPTAEISSSVLAGVGEIFLWPVLGTVLVGIEKGADVKLTKGDTTIHIDNPDDNKQKED